MPMTNPIQESLAARARELHGAGRTYATLPTAVVPAAAAAAAGAALSPALVQALLAELQRAYSLQYVSMVAQSDVVTDTEQPFLCDQLGSTDRYLPLVRNKTDNPIRVQVAAEFVTPGAGVKLAFASDTSDSTKIDTLALTANGRVLSVPIILGGGEVLWVNTHDTNFALTASDVLRVRIFDAARILGRLATNPPQALR